MVCNVTLPTGEYVPLRAIEEVPKRDGLDHVALFDGLRREFSRAGLRIRNPIDSDITVLEDRCYFLPDRDWPDIVENQGVHRSQVYVVLDKKEDNCPRAWMQFSCNTPDFYTLKTVEVIDDYQGEGYGSFLLTFLICCALQSGIDKIVIGSVTTEGAGLYSKMGFVPKGVSSSQWFSQHTNIRKEQFFRPLLVWDEGPIGLDLNNPLVQDRVWGVFWAATHKLCMCR